MILRQRATVKRSFTIPELHARPARIDTHRPPSTKARLAGRHEVRSHNSAISPDPEVPDLTRIRILSLDSHPLFRAGIAKMISEEPDMVLVSQVSTVQEAIQQYREHRPDITLMETRLRDLGGIEALIAIRAEFPAARIMVLTACDGDVDVQRALKAGGPADTCLKTRFPASYCRKSEKYIRAKRWSSGNWRPNSLSISARICCRPARWKS